MAYAGKRFIMRPSDQSVAGFELDVVDQVNGIRARRSVFPGFTVWFQRGAAATHFRVDLVHHRQPE